MIWQDYIDETSDNVVSYLEELFDDGFTINLDDPESVYRLMNTLSYEDDITGIGSDSYTCDADAALLNVRELVWDPPFKQYMRENKHDFNQFMYQDPERADAEARYYALYELDIRAVIKSMVDEKKVPEGGVQYDD